MNALTGIAVAHADQVPVLLLTAQVATHRFGMGAFQESSPEISDIVSLFKPVTKWSTMLPHPDRMGGVIRSALRLMQTGRPGPVHLSIPIDYITKTVSEEVIEPRHYRFSNEVFDRGSIRHAAQYLISARNPVILAGHGINISRAWQTLRQFSERLRIPIATSFKAKGCLPEDHPLSLGVLGPSGSPDVREYILGDRTDLIFVVGSSMGEVSSCGFDQRFKNKILLQVDIDPVIIGRNYPISVGMVGDARSVLNELRFELERQLRFYPDISTQRPQQFNALRELPQFPASVQGNKPQELLSELRSLLPRDSLIFVDNGSIRSWMGQYYPIYQENSFFVNMGLASMGYGVAGCIGAQMACPEKTVVCLAGDAAFAMNGTEVHTAVECDAPVIWVIFNNGGHGMIYHGERALYGEKFNSSIFRQSLDVATIARGLGAQSYVVEKRGDLTQAMTHARAARIPAVIEVHTQLGDAPPMGARVSGLRQELSAA
jgi:acetolactate synthase-1/2/3 large subunit